MAIYKLKENKIIELPKTSFIEEKIDEVRDMQEFITNSIDIIEKDLFIISSEFGDWEDSRRRIDVLCIDKDANLVVIELKRTEDGGHMELQSIRYAAMIANMTFDKAVKAYNKYLIKKNELEKDAESEILKFLNWDENNEEEFGNDVRIILVSADFSIEITTSVLWLIERDIDIKCIRIKLQKDEDDLYLDIQQIIPLPETADYQVKLREKISEQRQSRREGKRDYSKFNIFFDKRVISNLNKRATMILTMKECVNSGISPVELMKITGERRWIWVDKICNSKESFENEFTQKSDRKYDESRWFNSDEELMIYNNKTFVFSNQHGKQTEKLVKEIFETYPELNARIEKTLES